MNVEMDQNYAGPQLFWPNIVRAIGQAMVMTPLSTIAMLGIAPKRQALRRSLNMMRNLGGAIGTAAIETFFTKREQFHSPSSPGSLAARTSDSQPVTDLQQYFMSHGFRIQRAQCTAPSSPSVTRSAPRRRSWATPTALHCSVRAAVAAVMVAMLKKGATSGVGAH